MTELFSFQGARGRTLCPAAGAAWEIVLSLGSRRERSIRSIEIEVFQKFSNSLDFDTNSGPRYAVDFRNFSDVVSLLSVHGDNFQIFGFQSFECSKQLLVLNLTNPCKTAFSFVVSICHGNRILIA